MFKKKPYIAVILTILLMFAGNVVADSSEWTPITGNEHNMIVHGTVFIDGVDFSKGNYILVSFGPGGKPDCRSVSDIKKGGAFYATICGNVPGEPVSLMVISKANGDTISLNKKIIFEADGLLGNLKIE